MSIEVLLIPLGIAAYSAIRAGRDTTGCEKCQATRISDTELLIEGLRATGAEVLFANEFTVTARSVRGDLTFQKIGETFLGRVDRASEAITVEMLRELDIAVGRVAQARTITRLRQEAEVNGFRLVQEQEHDGSMTFLFEELR